MSGNDYLEKNLVLVEKVAHSKGLSPEAISIMLEFAMSLRMGKILILEQLRTECYCNSGAYSSRAFNCKPATRQGKLLDVLLVYHSLTIVTCLFTSYSI